jgi:hypothetical protein
MHTIEPYANWLVYYDSSADERSPFFCKEYNHDVYTDTVYGYYIDPAWDSFGSETLYLKTLYTDYEQRYVILEMIGEWNDAIHNDIMILKRQFLELLVAEGIDKFILIGEHILNFHGSNDAYYEEWFDDVDDGWIALVCTPEFVLEEMKRFDIDRYVNMQGSLQITNWRTMTPSRLFDAVDALIRRRLH